MSSTRTDSKGLFIYDHVSLLLLLPFVRLIFNIIYETILFKLVDIINEQPLIKWREKIYVELSQPFCILLLGMSVCLFICHKYKH